MRVIDDFAHHPTAIEATLAAVREQMPAGARLLAVLDPRSNSMRSGAHAARLAGSLQAADRIYLHAPADLGFDPHSTLAVLADRLVVLDGVDGLLARVSAEARSGDWVISMSNGGFGGFPARLVDRLGEVAA